MTVVPVKFRCYRCNQLLGVSPSKVGSVVACPKCAAELVVPDPDESNQAPTTDEPAVPDAAPEPFRTPASLFIPPETSPDEQPGVPLDFLNIRAEDVRDEPGPRGPAPGPASSATVAATVPTPPAAEPGPKPAPQDNRPPWQAVAAPTVRVPCAPLPAIQVDTTPDPSPRHRPVASRPRDLVLPRSVVASWSLFVLLALVAAFFAGLLAGHYVWKVH